MFLQTILFTTDEGILAQVAAHDSAAQEDAGRLGAEDEDTEEFVAHRPVTADRGGSEGVRKKGAVSSLPLQAPVLLLPCVTDSL